MPRPNRRGRPASPADAVPTEPAPPATGLAAPAESMDRVEQTIRWLLTGARDADVLEAIRTTWPDQEVKPLIAAAVEQLAQSGKFDRLVVRGWCFEVTKDLYRRMTEIGDFAGALRAVKQMWDLAA